MRHEPRVFFLKFLILADDVLAFYPLNQFFHPISRDNGRDLYPEI
jgi:hypothetical protein